ncbi:Guanine nucleotide exchange factor MSS4 like protein [Argiope bruennichi]|uniref:Guanine nucleotide exchange factor MSS4 like protein n=1 Tax=Argiope bruennichi TaxID=94029 RepID=A0A8T0FQC2_ARGBR|nr:Guanine nucleotide exchange factor MSS4 like protein [Argiope bruennichi]
MAEVTPTTIEEVNPRKENDGSKADETTFKADDAVTTDGRNFKLPDLKGEKATRDVINKYWCVENMYAFENVGFSNTVDGVKYLVCADCEVGPIGWHDLNTKLSVIRDPTDLCRHGFLMSGLYIHGIGTLDFSKSKQQR